MNRLGRTFLGAALGALFALILHPITRPYALCGIQQLGPSKSLQTSPLLTESFSVLPQPSTLVASSIWMQAGAERLRNRSYNSEAALKALIHVAHEAEREEPDNAFWPQMACVFSSAAGNEIDARAEWIRAAAMSKWNDYQSFRLGEARRSLSDSVGVEQSWQYSAHYYRRSPACAEAIHRYGRSLIVGHVMGRPDEWRLRFATLQNGALMRDNSRSIEIGMYGVSLIESSSVRSPSPLTTTPRKLLTARFALIDALQKSGKPDDAAVANKIFLDNDAWLSLLLRENPSEAMREWTLAGVGLATVPGCLLVVSVFGLFIALFGAALRKEGWLSRLVRPPIAPILGLAVALTVYALTGLSLFAITIVACFGFLGFGPQRPRTADPGPMGPLFDTLIGALALMSSLFLLVFMVGLTTPAIETLPFLNVPTEYYGGQFTPLGLAVIVFSLTLLVAPMHAIASRLPTKQVVATALRYFGTDMSVACAFLGLITIPFAVYADIRLKDNVSRALLNEPTFYLTR